MLSKSCSRIVAAVIAVCCYDSSSPAHAQDADAPAANELPATVIRVPKPARRPQPRVAARPVVAPTPAPQPEPTPAPEAAPEPGTLPVVANRFGTVTVVSGEELRRNPASTLGDQLFAKPGITGSSFAPGASSRPIIRGLDVNRVGIVENGMGGGGASDLGEDHFVPIDPLATKQIEVIRGPEALRFGSTSIGGVVSASDNRIPEAAPPCWAAAPQATYGQPLPTKAIAPGLARGPCATVETRGALSSVNDGLEGAVLLDAGGGGFAIHADGFARTASDYRIPSYPYLFAPGRPFDGRQPNSSLRTDGGSIGGSYLFNGGYIGAAIIQNDALYHIPGIDGEDHRTRIDAHQTKFTSKGAYRPDGTMIDAIRFWAGVTDYRHNELGLADPADVSTDGVRQTFTNREQEAKVETQLAPFDLRFASLTSTLGVQGGHQELTAPSPDNVGSIFNGLWNPNDNWRIAAYSFNEFKFSATTKAQTAGRIEHVELHGSTPDFPADFLPDGNPRTVSARDPKYTPKSVSVGLIQNLPLDLVGSITAQYVERAPKPAELFSRGAHDATATFDIGNPNLTLETAKTVEIGLRRTTGPFRFEATAYYTRFNNFIFRRLTGVLCADDFESCGAPGSDLNQAVYSQRDAIFRGGEFQSQLDVGQVFGGTWGIEDQFDVVRATFADGTNVPRIPPVRVGGGLFWHDAHWLARVNLLHAFAHTQIAPPPETPTAGYNLLKAELSYTGKIDMGAFGRRDLTVGLVGDNLLNQDIRNSVSYTKDEVLMPGLGVRAFANVKF